MFLGNKYSFNLLFPSPLFFFFFFFFQEMEETIGNECLKFLIIHIKNEYK